MPFEQRSSIYFVCNKCRHEYEIAGHAEYNTIYNCTKEGCDYRETFLGISTGSRYDISASLGDEQVGFFRRVFRNNLVQAVIVAVIMFILLALLAWGIANNLYSGINEELIKIKNEISLIKGE